MRKSRRVLGVRGERSALEGRSGLGASSIQVIVRSLVSPGPLGDNVWIGRNTGQVQVGNLRKHCFERRVEESKWPEDRRQLQRKGRNFKQRAANTTEL